MEPKIDRLAYADCAHVEDDLRARERGEALPPVPTDRAERAPPCCGCRGCGDVGISPSAAAPLSRGELDALHFRFWSADHVRFDHIGFANAVLAACTRRGTGPA